jgi:hypothetical protein
MLHFWKEMRIVSINTTLRLWHEIHTIIKQCKLTYLQITSIRIISNICTSMIKNCKKMQSCPCNRPWRSTGLRTVEDPTFSKQSTHRWRWGCQPYAPDDRPLPPGRFLVLISVRGSVDPRTIEHLEGLNQLKIPMTLLEIEPATSGL